MAHLTERSARAYERAQAAMAMLKSAVYDILLDSEPDGIRNVDVGRALGINLGHESHEGHIQRTLLRLMKDEGVASQDEKTKLWSLRKHGPD